MLGWIGCVSPIHRISYILDVPAAEEQHFSSIQNIYLLVRQPKRGLTMNVGQWSSALQNELHNYGGNILAARQIGSDDKIADDRFSKNLEPSSYFETEFQNISVDVYTTQKTVTVGSSTTARTVIQTTWHYSAYLSGTERTYSYPDASQLWEKTFTIRSGEYTHLNYEPSESDFNAVVSEALRKLARQTAEALSPVRPVFRERKLLFDSSDKKQASAVSFASKGQWDKATEIWNVRISSGHDGNWKDEWNLGVAAEVNRNKTKARENYEQARALAGTDMDAQKIPWDDIFSDLSKSRMPATPSEQALAWFGSAFAIVPFEENTTSIDGPQSIRKKIQEKLLHGGYVVMDLTKGDNVFQNHGLSDGGQLPAFKRENLSTWTNCPWLVFGDIEAFNEVNIGIYVKHEVHGIISVWDAKTKADIFSCDKTVKTQSIPTSTKGILTHFVANLAETWIDHASHTPLAPEVNQFVDNCFAEFPMRP